jgi:hypothetical protein
MRQVDGWGRQVRDLRGHGGYQCIISSGPCGYMAVDEKQGTYVIVWLNLADDRPSAVSSGLWPRVHGLVARLRVIGTVHSPELLFSREFVPEKNNFLYSIRKLYLP